MVSSGKVSCIVFIEYLLVYVMCVLVHVHVLVGVNVSVIIVWIHVAMCNSAHSCGCVSNGRDALAAF